MKTQPKAGLLPLYLKLYDEVRPQARTDFEPYIDLVGSGLRSQDLEVVRAPICTTSAEFKSAVAQFEADGVDLIVTLHLAYSPSLESIDALAASKVPILLLDTTMDGYFGLDVDPDRIMYNHGIHGVQDLANVLRRRKKAFSIVAGHLDNPAVLKRAASIARAALASRLLGSMRVLRIGETFRGMGDFNVSDSLMQEALGVHVTTVEPSALEPWVNKVTDDQIDAEVKRDRENFTVEAPESAHQRSVKVGLGLRAYLEAEKYGAFSANFLSFISPDGPVDTVPFLEASKAMARGLGYAGEGDALTAALVGALNAAFGEVNFTEMFCPDWDGGTVFLSHMGEFNPACAGAKPRMFEKDFIFTPAQNPAIITAPPKPGPAVYVNLAPGPDDSFSLIVAPVDVLGEATHPGMSELIRGWFRPTCPLESFLEQYSELGGTHHAAIVHGGSVEAIRAFAAFAGIPSHVIA